VIIYIAGSERKYIMDKKIDMFMNALKIKIDATKNLAPQPIKKSTPKTSHENLVEAIKKAKELLDLGAITEIEFQEIKNKY